MSVSTTVPLSTKDWDWPIAWRAVFGMQQHSLRIWWKNGKRPGERGLKKLPGVRTSRLFVHVDVRSYGQTDEQWSGFGIIISQLDSNRQPLDDLDKVAGRILGRQKRQ